MQIDTRAFRTALGSFATGVTVITASNADGGVFTADTWFDWRDIAPAAGAVGIIVR